MTDEERSAVNAAHDALEHASAPMCRDKETKAMLINEITTLLSAYPFGVRHDQVAMKYKVKAFVAALKEQPMWAVKEAVQERITSEDTEPSTGQFLKDVKKQFLEIEKLKHYLARAKRCQN